MDFSAMSAEDLTSAATEARTKATALFALTAPSITEVDEAEALVASLGQIEAEQATREQARTDAADRFAAARAAFSDEAEVEAADEVVEDEDEDEEPPFAADEAEEVEAAAEDAEEDEAVEETADADAAPDTVTASVNHTKAQTINTSSAARAVGRKVKRPQVAAASPVTIIAAADIPNVPMGSALKDMNAVASALKARGKGFAPFNIRAAEAANKASGGEPVLNKYAVASFGLQFDKSEVASKTSDDYASTQSVVKAHKERVTAGVQATLSGKADTLTAAGWCAPSPYVYNWIADFVVDGLLTLPEIAAPRGGLQITQGPQLLQSTYADPDDFGFGGTEAQAIAGTAKTLETIECPDFVDHRLDWTGYGWTIPFLTEHAYPELVADALRLSNVAYAHKMNRRFINAVLAGSTARPTAGYGATFTDSLEALTQIAVKERRWWNLGENAVMEVKLPQEARDIYKFDMSRRSGLALNDIATDQKIAAHFANHNLSVEYLSDFDQTPSGTATATWPANIRAIIYPAGTFAKAVDDVVNLSAIHDAASLSANEYTGVFFEQGTMTLKLGYNSHVVTVPVCTAGATGANVFVCDTGSI